MWVKLREGKKGGLGLHANQSSKSYAPVPETEKRSLLSPHLTSRMLPLFTLRSLTRRLRAALDKVSWNIAMGVGASGSQVQAQPTICCMEEGVTGRVGYINELCGTAHAM